ncbi:MAG: DUF1289 domain-containing protein [Roseateles depolymerans]|uniref:DUF1289 domain-containing protein n=1 Tax=Roseateles depolymerans TaxID=76731 RepID=A0A2W5G042_9BURK|nr:MAG: DUF1289 domain-containing protein [Roseateles depolymerans]
MAESPCTKVCQLDPATQWCRGCARDLVEITAWGRASEAEQQAILERLAVRQRQLEQAGQWLGAGGSESGR